jgi:lipid-A-disaccharide synthase-like uncharacterized protein
MELLNWLAEHGFDLIQTIGIVGGLLFTAHAILQWYGLQT